MVNYLYESEKVKIVGKSSAMVNLLKLTNEIAKTNSTVMILGESGTGKEVFAKAIHEMSFAKKENLVTVNCAGISPNLLESELFGHEKGAFTGAFEQRIGKFELANEGTIFLDEIGELPYKLQAKLLRVLQEKELERVGGKQVIKVNPRVIVATNRDLQREIERGNFRLDLFYRLNVFQLTIPPLRERREDILELGAFFLNRHAEKIGRKPIALSSKSKKRLLGYSWPGNVRELENFFERTLIFNNGKSLLEDIDRLFTGNIKNGSENKFKTLADQEKEHILKALEICNGKIYGPGGAAELLDLKVSTLNSKIKKLGIKKKEVEFI